MDLAGKTVLVTGATGGIGQAICHDLARTGARVVMVSRSEDQLSRLCLSLEPGHEHRYIALDLCEPYASERLNDFILQNGLSIDVLINNAGSNRFSYLAERHEHDIRNELALNLITPILMSKMSLHWPTPPSLILNIGSTFAAIGYPGYSIYCAAKSGLHRFTESLNRELQGAASEHTTKVLYLAPRATSTALNSDAVNQMNLELGNRSDTPEFVARQVITMLESESLIKWLGWPEKLFTKVNQLMPKLVSQAIAKQFPIIQRYLTAGRSLY